MEFSKSNQEESFAEEVRTWLEEHLVGEFSELRNRGGTGREDIPIEILLEWEKELAEGGWLGLDFPEELGGRNCSLFEQVIFHQTYVEARAPGRIPNIGETLLAPTLIAYGTHEQQTRFIPEILKGNEFWCQGYSEPDAGSDLANISTRAMKEGDQWVINGQKIWTSTAKFAQMCFCLVRTEPDAPKHQGISYLLIPMDTPGIEIRPIMQMTGDADFNEVFFTDVRIPAPNIVGERGEGWKVANATLTHERGSLADPDVMMNRLYALIDLMKSETIDGERVIDKPAFRDRLLRVQGKVLAQQANALRLLSSSINKGQDTTMARFITKLIGTELRHELEGLAIDAMGEMGTLYEDSPHLRDSGSWQMSYMYFLGLIIGGGTNQIQKNIISERALGMPKEPKIPGA